jgi:hypothetical protein
LGKPQLLAIQVEGRAACQKVSTPGTTEGVQKALEHQVVAQIPGAIKMVANVKDCQDCLPA